MIRRWLAAAAARVILRVAGQVAALVFALAVALAALPVSLTAAGAVIMAWWRGWQPRRLFTAAAWCGPMTATWLALTGLGPGGWHALGAAPQDAWLAFWRLAGAGSYFRAAAVAAPLALPLGLAAGGLAWSWRIRTVTAGAAGRSPASSVAFDQRQWRHQVRAAKARIAVPGSVPLTLRGDQIALGAVIRAVRHKTGPLATIGYERLRSHQVIVGTTGTGKTTLLLRLWAGFMATGLRRHSAGAAPAPLLVVLDCKGGADARKIADRFGRVLRDAGARSVAIWPDEASLSLWSLPPRQLTTTLVDLIEHGTGSAAYYADVMEALVALAVEAPCGPPASSRDLLTRLEPGWLAMAYAGTGSTADHAMIRSAARHLSDVALRFRTLFRRLGDGLDGTGGFADADAWYCILEGTDQIAVAEGQARALVDLLASFAARGEARREILLAVDEFSAVSRRLPIWQLYERARSLGLAVQVSAQSWQGLAATHDERYRIAAAAEGGIWLLRTPQPEPLTTLAGSRQVIDTTRQLGRFGGWSRRGYSRLRRDPVADPELIRVLDVGQSAYLDRGGVTFIQVQRLIATAAAVSGGPAGTAGPPEPAQAGGREEHRAALPDIGDLLDAAFGPEPAA